MKKFHRCDWLALPTAVMVAAATSFCSCPYQNAVPMARFASAASFVSTFQVATTPTRRRKSSTGKDGVGRESRRPGNRHGKSHSSLRTNSHVLHASSTSTYDENDDRVTVAIIGGGVAGLSCARHLAASGRCNPTVFDTGRLRPGGRCSSRQPGDPPKMNPILGSHTIDHAAQIVTVTEPNSPFASQVRKWEEGGVLKRFPKESVCEIRPHDTRPFDVKELNGGSDKGEAVMYYGANGMVSIPMALVHDGNFAVEQDVWVSPSNGVKYVGTNRQQAEEEKGAHMPRWRVKAKGQILGDFDRLVIAHNGKCADRLMSRTPARGLHSLLRVNFSPTVPAWGGKRMTLNSIYSLSFALKAENSPLSEVLPDNVYSAFIKNEPTIRFLSSNTRKHPGRVTTDAEVWTLLSSAKFAKKFKAPQENLPEETVDEVTTLMLQGLERSLGIEDGTVTENVLDSRLQLWGAAVPVNTWAQSPGFLYDEDFGVGACGDWLLHPSIEGAWESGRRLAQWITKEARGEKSIPSFSAGLPPRGGKFQASMSALERGIGSFEAERAPATVGKA